MTDARKTLEFCIINGLAERAHITGANPDHAPMQAEDIIKQLFDPGHRWAVRAYLQELSDKDLAAIWLRPAGPSQ